MGNPVVHFEISTKSPQAVRDFYAKIFGWGYSPAAGSRPYMMVDTGSPTGIPGGIGLAEGSENMVTFYIEVSDPQTTLQEIESRGGETVVPLTEVPGGVTFAVFEDPDGNRVGLVKEQAVAVGAVAQSGASGRTEGGQ